MNSLSRIFTLVSFLLLVSCEENSNGRQVNGPIGSPPSLEVINPSQPGTSIKINEEGKILEEFNFKVGLKNQSNNESGSLNQKSWWPGRRKKNYNVESLEIDVKKVFVHTKERGWELINDTRQTIDVLKLKDDASIVLADRRLQPGQYTQMRLLLGKNNKIVVDGRRRKLLVPFGRFFGIKINLKQVVKKGYITDFKLIFNMKKSLFRLGFFNTYILKPVFRVENFDEDLLAPEIIISEPDNNSLNPDSNINLKIDYSDDFLDLDSLSVMINGERVDEEFTVGADSASYTKSFSDGHYSIESSISDEGGNSSSTDVVKFTVDTSAPIIEVSLEEDVLTNIAFLPIQFQVSDLTDVNIKVYLNNSIAYETTQKNDGTNFILKEGGNTIKVVAIDSLGHSSEKIFENIILDTVAPVITGVEPAESKRIYVNQETRNFSMIAYFNEKISHAVINNERIDGLQFANGFSVFREILNSEVIILNGHVYDSAGNRAEFSSRHEVVFDDVAPILTVNMQSNIYTNTSNHLFSYQVNDDSPVELKVNRNGEQVSLYNQHSGETTVELTEGNNTFEFLAKDMAGNISNLDRFENIIYDSRVPIIQLVSHENGEYIREPEIEIVLDSNEHIDRLHLNDTPVNFVYENDQLKLQYLVPVAGENVIKLEAFDRAGNSAITQFDLKLVRDVILPELVSITPTEDGMLQLEGSKFSSVPNTEIKINYGIFNFNSKTTYSDEYGRFSFLVDNFNKAILSAIEPNSGERKSFEIGYNLSTKISGIVKGIDEKPISGALIRLKGSPITTLTEFDGSFTIDNPTPGDQKIEVDAYNSASNSDEERYSRKSINVNIGIGQENVIPYPIYMAPLLLDGSETVITKDQGGMVESIHAPGVALEIEPGSVEFPNSEVSGSINIAVSNIEKLTIPIPKKLVVPNVYNLEPSGTTFSKPVKLTLPNESNLPAGVEMLILSLNSDTGVWEVDGVAKVSDSGADITTKDGMGITHFSEVVAIPAKPLITKYGGERNLGSSSDSGALVREVNLPSIPFNGGKYSPKLTYNSSTARTMVTHTDLISVPEKKYEIKKIEETVSDNRILEDVTCFLSVCWGHKYDYYVQTTEYDLKNWYEPTQLKGSFILGRSEVTSSTQSNLYESEEKIYTEIPYKSLITYSFELEADSKELPSGVYPGLSQYEVKVNNILMGDVTSTIVFQGSKNVIREDTFEINRDPVEEALDLDYFHEVPIINKQDSEIGRGWSIGGVSEIMSKETNSPIVYEGNQEISKYYLSSSVETVVHADIEGLEKMDLSNAMGLDDYPVVSVPLVDDDGKISVIKYNIENGNKENLFEVDINNLEVDISEDAQEWGLSDRACNYLDVWHWVSDPLTIWKNKAYKFSGTQKPKISSILKYGDNYHVLNRNYSSISYYDQSGSFQSGYEKRISPTLLRPNDCKSIPGGNCTAQENSDTRYYCYYRHTASKKVNATEYQYYFSTPSEYHLASYHNSIPMPNDKMDTPSDAIVLANGQTIVASTGHNRIYNIDTNQVIAGDGTNTDVGDNALATEVSIFHPTALAADNEGNLYIASEKGYIRKLSSNGYIEKIAGLPISEGGVYTPSAPSKKMYLDKPSGLLVDSENKILYVADTGNNRVVAIDLIGSTAKTIAGNSQCSSTSSADLIDSLDYSLCAPTKLAFDNAKNLLVVDSGHNKLVRINLTQSGNNRLTFNPKIPDGSQLIRNADSSWERHFRNGVKQSFNSLGKIVTEENLNSQAVNFSYDSDGRLTRVEDSYENFISYSYSGDLLSVVSDSAGRTYDIGHSNGNLSSVGFPGDLEESFEYDENLMSSYFDKNGNETKFEFDSLNRLAKVTNAKNEESVLITVESHAVEKQNSGSLATLNGEESIENEITSQDGNSISYSHDINGYIQDIKDKEGKVSRIIRNRYGKPVEVKSHNGETQSFKYADNLIDLIEVSSSENGIISQFEYDKFGNKIKEISINQNVTTRLFDQDKNLLVSESNSVGASVSYTYDISGRVLDKTSTIDDSSNYVISFTYNDLGLLSSKSDSYGGESLSFYNDSGDLIERKIKKGAGEHQSTLFSYDQLGRLLSVQENSGDTTFYSYDGNGNLVSLTNPIDGTESFVYDVLNRVTQKTNVYGDSEFYTYNLNGGMATKIDYSGALVKYEYNIKGNLTKKTLTDNVYTYEYDDNEKLTLVENLTSRLEYTYDPTGEKILGEKSTGLNSLSDYPSTDIAYTYDDSDRIVSMSNGGSYNIAYSYDVVNRLSALDTSIGRFEWNYDKLGRMLELKQPNAIVSKYQYDGNSSASSRVEHVLNSNVLLYRNLNHDLSGQLLSSDGAEGNYNYSYDSRNFLSSSSTPHETNSFTYDKLGNMLSNSTNSFEYDSQKRRLTKDSFYNYQYDKNGNLLSKAAFDGSKSWVYDYNSENQLTRVRELNGLSVSDIVLESSYSYDAVGRRIRKSVTKYTPSEPTTDTRQYAYSGENIFKEYNGGGSELASYVHSPQGPDNLLGFSVTTEGVAAGVSTTQGNYYVAKDHLGSITEVLDSTGSIVQRNRYTAFGKLVASLNAGGSDISASPDINIPFSFTGRELDVETGLMYYRARYYDPAIGRFLQEDPHPGKMKSPITLINKYVYTGNNPTNYVDPDGRLFWFVAIAGLIGGVGNAAANGWTLSSFLTGVGMGMLSAIFPAAGAQIAIGWAGATTGTTLAVAWGAVGGAVGSGVFGSIVGASGPQLGLMMLFGAVGGAMIGQFGVGSLGPKSNGQEAIYEGIGSHNSSIGTGAYGGHPLGVGGGAMRDSFVPIYDYPGSIGNVPDSNWGHPQIGPK